MCEKLRRHTCCTVQNGNSTPNELKSPQPRRGYAGGKTRLRRGGVSLRKQADCSLPLSTCGDGVGEGEQYTVRGMSRGRVEDHGSVAGLIKSALWLLLSCQQDCAGRW